MLRKNFRSRLSVFSRIAFTLALTVVTTLSLRSSAFADPIHTRLNPTSMAGNGLYAYADSPDGASVAYIADQAVKGVQELYLVPMSGGTPTKLNPAIVAGIGVYAARFTPDSKYVVYKAEQEASSLYAIYSVPRAGGTAINLSGTPPASSYPYRYKISADSKWVVYTIERDLATDRWREIALMSSPIDHSAPVSLTVPMPANYYVSDFVITPDSKRVIYMTGPSDAFHYELLSIPIQGKNPTKLNVTLVGESSVIGFSVTPDSTHVLYVVESVNNSQRTSQLYSVPIAGGTSVPIGVPEAGRELLSGFTPDGSKVLINVFDYFSQGYKLYVAPVAGGTPVLLDSATSAPGSYIQVYYAQFVLDGSGVVFHVIESSAGKHSYYMPVSGGGKRDLLSPAIIGQNEYYFKLTPDGKKLVHILYAVNHTLSSLFLTDIISGNTITLTTMGSDYDPLLYFTPDGTSLIYRGKTTTSSAEKLLNASLSDGLTTVFSVASSLPVDVFYPAEPVVHNGDICMVYFLGMYYQGLGYPYPQQLYSSCYTAPLLPPTATPTISPTPSPTATATSPTATPTRSSTPSPTATSTDTLVPTETSTSSPTATSTASNTPLPTSTASATATATPTTTPSATTVPAAEPTTTSTIQVLITPTPTQSNTPIPTMTATVIASITPTPSATVGAKPTMTEVPFETATALPIEINEQKKVIFLPIISRNSQ